jgi:heme-degrading monooxygenase HmoA
MILEVADIRVLPGQEAEFGPALERALRTVASRAAGVQGWRVHQCLETPQRFVLQIEWATLEDHTVGFRQSPLFAEWRAIIGPFFAQPPLVEHFNLLTQSN